MSSDYCQYVAVRSCPIKIFYNFCLKRKQSTRFRMQVLIRVVHLSFMNNFSNLPAQLKFEVVSSKDFTEICSTFGHNNVETSMSLR